MTKGELKKALLDNELPDYIEVLISIGTRYRGEAIWIEIDSVDGTENGIPILIGLGKTVMD